MGTIMAERALIHKHTKTNPPAGMNQRADRETYAALSQLKPPG